MKLCVWIQKCSAGTSQKSQDFNLLAEEATLPLATTIAFSYLEVSTESLTNITMI